MTLNGKEARGEAEIRQFYNHSVISFAIAAADQCGLFDLVRKNGQLALPDLQLRSEYAHSFGRQLIKVLVDAQILRERESTSILEAGALFDAAYINRGFFTWLLVASGPVLGAGGQVMSNGLEQDDLPARDQALIGSSTAKFVTIDLDRALLSVEELKNARCVVDMGCGNGTRLIEVIRRTEARGIGVDISGESIEQSRAMWADSAFGDRVRFLQADARSLAAHRMVLEDADVLIMALMAHDLLPRSEFIKTMTGWRTYMPKCRTLLICETFSDPDVMASPIGSRPLPVLGYEYLHSLMNIDIPSRREWLTILSDSGWPCRRTIKVDIPASTEVFVCTSPEKYVC